MMTLLGWDSDGQCWTLNSQVRILATATTTYKHKHLQSPMTRHKHKLKVAPQTHAFQASPLRLPHSIFSALWDAGTPSFSMWGVSTRKVSHTTPSLLLNWRTTCQRRIAASPCFALHFRNPTATDMLLPRYHIMLLYAFKSFVRFLLVTNSARMLES
jgi:hypothetical protein